MRSSHATLIASLLGLAAALPAQLNGTYLVGSGGNYANIAAAVADLQAVGVAGPVTFLVNANDSGPWTINAFAGQGPANPVLFDALGPVTISGTQPVLTLTGCANVTFRGFDGTFTNTPSSFVINAGTTDCAFTGCDFRATVSTSGAALFNIVGGSGLRIEDSTFGGGYEALYAQAATSFTTVQRCKILGGGFWIMRIAGSDFTLANNFITGNSNYGISAGVSGNTAASTNLKIVHNSVYSSHTSSASQYCTLRWYSAAAGTEVQNNIFCDIYPTATATGFNMWCSGALRPTLMNYNCFRTNYPGTFPVYASANRTLAAWQGLGFDQNSFEADPLFTAPGTTTTDDLTLQPGSPCSMTGTPLALVTTDYFLYPRTPAVSIGAHEQDAGFPASYTGFAAGCAGTAGTPSNTASAPPRLGTSTSITFGNLPAPSAAIALIGLSNTVSAFGPLPLDLSSFGGTGCFARVSADATVFVLGAGGSASLPINTPNDPGMMGLMYYTQALVLDSTLNGLGASMSDAAVAQVGL